uniref:Fibulin 5 n=1 Tax=Oryzias melastigma TaxID=30732 RepID=A0A3B3E0P4_ORYME
MLSGRGGLRVPAGSVLRLLLLGCLACFSIPGRRASVLPGSFRMLAALVLVLLWVQSALGQVCSPGFAFDEAIGECRDVNECLTLGRVCQGGMDCVNRVGGYTCVPSEAYQRPYRQSSPVLPETSYPELSDPVSDTFLPAPPRFVEPSYPRIRNPALCTLGYALAADGTCNDIDECETNSHQCHHTQVCINTAGGYTCTCAEGYWLFHGQCQDIDECRYGYCQQLCANAPGSYSCSCNPGFLLNSDGRTCQDVDECEEEPCNHACFNTYGSFMCNCDEGFELASDGTTCIDLDECSFSEFLCQHTCVNSPGSFSCICPAGYYLYDDDRSCEGKVPAPPGFSRSAFLTVSAFMWTLSLTLTVVCLISKISMNVTLVTTPVQQNKYVSISREATHAWVRYSVSLLTWRSLTSECAAVWAFWGGSGVVLTACCRLQSVHVLSGEPRLQRQALHYSVPTHGPAGGAQCACRYLPDAGHHALPRRLLHLPDKVGERRARVLHEANQPRQRHAGSGASHQRAQKGGSGPGDGHRQQRHQLQRQLHHPADDIRVGASVLSS